MRIVLALLFSSICLAQGTSTITSGFGLPSGCRPGDGYIALSENGAWYTCGNDRILHKPSVDSTVSAVQVVATTVSGTYPNLIVTTTPSFTSLSNNPTFWISPNSLGACIGSSVTLNVNSTGVVALVDNAGNPPTADTCTGWVGLIQVQYNAGSWIFITPTQSAYLQQMSVCGVTNASNCANFTYDPSGAASVDSPINASGLSLLAEPIIGPGTFTTLLGDGIYNCDATSGSTTLALQDNTVNVLSGRIWLVNHIAFDSSGNPCILVPHTGQSIDDTINKNIFLYQNDFALVMFDDKSSPKSWRTFVSNRLPTHTPSSSSDTGVAGTVTWDSSFIYVCIATNTWKRIAIVTW